HFEEKRNPGQIFSWRIPFSHLTTHAQVLLRKRWGDRIGMMLVFNEIGNHISHHFLSLFSHNSSSPRSKT
ncbi:hypothetical protein ACHAXS_006232, partial [Conticribra weissflogii]